MSVTFNVFVKSDAGSPVAGARVTALSRNQLIDPPTRYTSGDGGANLYFQGPEISPAAAVTLLVDAAGYAPWCSQDQPVSLGTADVNYAIVLRSIAPPAPAPAHSPAPSQGSGTGAAWRQCASQPGTSLVQCIIAAINPAHTVEGAFEVTKRVAWQLRDQGFGLLRKDGGDNIVAWKGRSFSASRVCYRDGHIYKVLTDVPTTNGPSWQDNQFVDVGLYVPAIDPDS
ncbi:MAG TPA: hypothetical protein VKE96_03340 [Vicinamibacterales bacterium]|nr:hypothetical protein [Vicinamibacterales bacterium]